MGAIVNTFAVISGTLSVAAVATLGGIGGYHYRKVSNEHQHLPNIPHEDKTALPIDKATGMMMVPIRMEDGSYKLTADGKVAVQHMNPKRSDYVLEPGEKNSGMVPQDFNKAIGDRALEVDKKLREIAHRNPSLLTAAENLRTAINPTPEPKGQFNLGNFLKDNMQWIGLGAGALVAVVTQSLPGLIIAGLVAGAPLAIKYMENQTPAPTGGGAAAPTAPGGTTVKPPGSPQTNLQIDRPLPTPVVANLRPPGMGAGPTV